MDGTSFKSRILAATTFMLMSWLAGCGASRTQPQASQLQHTVGEPIRANHRGQWIAFDEAQYRSIILEMHGLGKRAILPADDAVTQRLQFWVDEIDQAIRREHPEALANVPRPEVKVLAASGKNAMVVAAPVCYPLRVDLSGLEIKRLNVGKTTPQMHIDLRTGRLFTQYTACGDGKGDIAALAESLAYFNARSQDCQYRIDGDLIRPTQACVDQEKISGFAASEKVVVNQTINIISVLAALVPAMSEHQVVAILAHELGHYYRSHPTAAPGEYEYYYRSGRHNDPKKPLADASLNEMGQKAVAATKDIEKYDYFLRVPEQKLNSEIFMTVSGLVKDLCKDGSCSDACSKANQLLDHDAFINAMENFPFAKNLSSAMQEAYFQFEPKALACLASVPFVADDAKVPGLSWRQIEDRVKKPHNPSWTFRLEVSKWYFYNSEQAQRLAGIEKNFSTAADAILAASGKMDAFNADLIKTLRDAQNLSLGHYSIEQEADDFALEWLAKIGLDPRSLIEAMWILYVDKKPLGGFNYGKKECEELYARKWRDNDGKDVTVPVGDYTATHHGVCYRIFNMTREIEAHKTSIVARPEGAPLPDPSGWKDIQVKADDFSKSW